MIGRGSTSIDSRAQRLPARNGNVAAFVRSLRAADPRDVSTPLLHDDPRVFAAALKAFGRTVDEDILLDAAVDAYLRAAATYEPSKGAWSGFFLGWVYWTLLPHRDVRTKANRTQALLSPIPDEFDRIDRRAVDPCDAAASAETAARVRNAVREHLSAGQQAVIALRFGIGNRPERLTIKAISDRLRVDKATVHRRLNAALLRLRAALSMLAEEQASPARVRA